HFSSANSSDPRGGTLAYLWDFGDGTTSTAANPQHVFTLACGYTGCKYTVTLTVTSSVSGASGSAGLIIGVGEPPIATITSPDASLAYKVGDVISFGGLGHDHVEGDLPPEDHSWQVIAHHCPGDCHPPCRLHQPRA